MGLTYKQKLIRILGLILFVPCLSGVVTGILCMRYDHIEAKEDMDSYHNEIHRARAMDVFSIPGQSIHDTPLPPFHVPQLRTHNWRSKLNLSKAPADEGSIITLHDVASFDGLYVSDSQLADHWIYFTYHPLPEVDPWDKVFDEVVQHHAYKPPAHNASLFYVKCLSARFLCTMWGVTPPALMRVSSVPELCQPNPFIDGSRAFHHEELSTICPVEARVIDLPLRDELIPGRFPSRLHQMLSLTEDNTSYSSFPAFDIFETHNNRWIAHLNWLRGRWTPLHILMTGSECFKALPSPLGSILDTAETCAHFTAQILTGLTLTLGKFVSGQMFGLLRGSGAPPTASPSSSEPSSNPMDSLLFGLMEAVSKNMSDEEITKIMDAMQALNSSANITAT